MTDSYGRAGARTAGSRTRAGETWSDLGDEATGAHAPHAVDGGDSMNNKGIGSDGQQRSRARVSRTAGLLAVAVLFVLAAAAIVPGAARAATYNTWTKQTSGATQTLYSIDFIDANNGWLVGAAGVTRHTTNGGTTWTAQTSGVTTTLQSVYFTDANNGWSVGTGGVVRHTTNGGTTWTAQTSGVTTTLYGVYFTDANTGWIAGAGGVIRHTINGGTTWTSQTSGVGTNLEAVSFVNATTGWIVGASGVIRHTTNGGTNWTSQTSGVTRTLYGVCFTDANNGWVAGSRGYVRHTTNGGTAWIAQTSGVTVTLYGARFTDANNGWVVGAAGTKIPHTTNGGTAWKNQTSPSTQTQRSIVFAAGSLWTCGNGGVVLNYLVDTTPPVTVADGLQTTNNSGWRATAQTVTLSATDGQSGVKTTYYKLDGGAQQTYSAPFAVSGQGTHTVVYWSVDVAGNTEAQHTGYVNIDTTPPVTTAVNLQVSATTGWLTTGQTVTLSATDAQSGVTTTYYTVDGGGQQLYAGPFLVSGNSSHTVTYHSVDAAGNIEVTRIGYVNIDTTPPVTTATGLQADNHTVWQNVSQVVSLAGNDPLSGVAITYYTLDSVTRQTYTTPFTVSGQGVHTITYWSVDAVGNIEAVRSGYVNIDTTRPTVTDDSDERLAQDRRDRRSDPRRHRRQRSGRHAVSPAGRPDLDAGHRQRLCRAGPVRRLGRRHARLPVPGPRQRRQRQRDGQLHGVDRRHGADDHAQRPGRRSVLRVAGHRSDGDPVGRRRRRLRCHRNVLHGRQRRPADLLGRVHRLGRRSASGDLLVYRCRRQPGDRPHRLGEHLQPVRPGDEPRGQRPLGLGDAATTVTITGGGDHSPITISYKLDNAAGFTTVASPASFVVSGQASHTVVFYATNDVGVQSAVQTGYVNIDTTKPVTQQNGLQADGLRAGVTPRSRDTHRHRRALRSGHHLLHRQRRPAADLQRAVCDLGGRSERHRLLVGRRGRQHRGPPARLRQHRHHQAGHPAERSAGRRPLGLA